MTESGIGRLDSVVMTFALQPAIPAGPMLVPGQSPCVRLVRAQGFQDAVEIAPGPGYTDIEQPGTGSEGSVVPTGCSGQCRVQVAVRTGATSLSIALAYRD